MNECPKCGKQEIWEFGKIVSGSIGGIEINFVPEHKKLTTLPPRVYSYACKNCGYLESYIDPKELKKILKK
ncbi:MAG: hypothetical protein KAJ51_07135 [Thermoplasmata archaeon]|nr:hypothetical protein [Thermoplasmata archaeon]